MLTRRSCHLLSFHPLSAGQLLLHLKGQFRYHFSAVYSETPHTSPVCHGMFHVAWAAFKAAISHLYLIWKLLLLALVGAPQRLARCLAQLVCVERPQSSHRKNAFRDDGHANAGAPPIRWPFPSSSPAAPHGAGRLPGPHASRPGKRGGQANPLPGPPPSRLAPPPTLATLGILCFPAAVEAAMAAASDLGQARDPTNQPGTLAYTSGISENNRDPGTGSGSGWGTFDLPTAPWRRQRRFCGNGLRVLLGAVGGARRLELQVSWIVLAPGRDVGKVQGAGRSSTGRLRDWDARPRMGGSMEPCCQARG